MNQFDEIVLVDDLARGNGQIFPHLEITHLGPVIPEQFLLNVPLHIADAFQQIPAFVFPGGLKNLGVGLRQIGR